MMQSKSIARCGKAFVILNALYDFEDGKKTCQNLPSLVAAFCVSATMLSFFFCLFQMLGNIR